MQTETFILEEINLGDAQKAYENYFQIEKIFHDKLNEYKRSVLELETKAVSSISIDEMRHTDKILHDIEEIVKSYTATQGIVNQKLDSLLNECNQKRGDLDFHMANSEEHVQETEQSLKLYEEALKLKEDKKIILAIDKAYTANQSFNTLLSKINSQWINQHMLKLKSLTMDVPVISL